MRAFPFSIVDLLVDSKAQPTTLCDKKCFIVQRSTFDEISRKVSHPGSAEDPVIRRIGYRNLPFFGFWICAPFVEQDQTVSELRSELEKAWTGCLE